MSDISKKNNQLKESLAALLAEAENDAERNRLKRAWDALGALQGAALPPPVPGAELERIFSGQATSTTGELMSEDDLNMVAAAGIVNPELVPGEPFQPCEILMGGGGDDNLEGGDADSIMYGFGGDDTMHGGAGDDHLDGGEGDDILDGGTGDDLLLGGAGNDTLTGGEGNDEFLFGQESGNDTITDFEPGDTITLLGATSMEDFSVDNSTGDTVITFGDTIITITGASLTAEEIWAMQQNSTWGELEE